MSEFLKISNIKLVRNQIIIFRYGHILHALHFVNQDLVTEQLYELGHHLLKANPAKYMPIEIAPNMPSGRDAQVLWLQKASSHRLQLALLYDRNIYYPNSKVTRLMLMAGATSNVLLHDKDTLLCKYASAGNNTLIQLLVQYGADVNARNQSTGLTPLMCAIKSNHFSTVELLLQCGASITVQDFKGKTALVHTASINSVEMFSLIFESEWSTDEGQTDDKSNEVCKAFNEAVKNGNIELCKYILDKTDASIDLSTSLMVACCSRNVDAINFLVSRGAFLKPDQKYDGKSSFLCAVQSGNFELTKNFLNNTNLKINTEVSSEGYSALTIAAQFGHNGLIEELLNKGL